MEIHYTPKGVCSKGIDIELDGDIIKSVKFTGGCNGNTQGVAALAKGMTVEEYIKRCKQVDPQCFMFITNTSEIIGKGFRSV